MNFLKNAKTFQGKDVTGAIAQCNVKKEQLLYKTTIDLNFSSSLASFKNFNPKILLIVPLKLKTLSRVCFDPQNLK